MSDIEPRNNADLTRGRPFAAGNPGRPKGSKSQISLLMEEVTADPQALKEVAAKVLEKARAGTPWACELLFARLWPEPKPRGALAQFELPLLNTLADVAVAINAVLQAVADGSITVDEGEAMASIISKYAQPVIEQADLERRILALEDERR